MAETLNVMYIYQTLLNNVYSVANGKTLVNLLYPNKAK